MRKQFTLQQGLDIQEQDIKTWMKKLNKKCFSALCAEATRQNGFLTSKSDGYNVWRGSQISEFIQNWKPS